jgi:hypothetical protein
MKVVESDIVVIGGGLAGVCAAISSARLGNKVILINNRPVFGGNSSSEIRVWTRGSTGGGNIYSEEMGILGELKLANQYRNSECNPVIWDDIILDAILMEKNLQYYSNTQVVDADITDYHINSIEAFSINDENHYKFVAPYFIDASGDGLVTLKSGMEYRIGKESKYEFNEKYADEVASNRTQGCTLLFFTIMRDHKVDYKAPSYVYSLEKIEKILGNGGRVVNEKTDGSDFWWIEYGGESDKLTDIQNVTLELKKLSLGVYNYIKNSGKFDSDNLDLLWTSNLPGKRESRRFKTQHQLTSTEIIENKVFDDVAFYGGWFLDFHPSKGIYSTENSCLQIKVPVYGIPLGCLYNTKQDNLLLAGRIIGTTHAAFASTRIMDTCALSGQAAGTAASVLFKNKEKTSYLQENYKEVQESLIDMMLIGKEPHENGLSYSVEASSIKNFEHEENGQLELKDDVFLTLSSSEVNKATLCIDNLNNEDVSIKVKAISTHLPNTCVKDFVKFDPIILKKGRNEIDLSFIKGLDKYLTIVFEKQEGVYFPLQKDNLFGVLIGYYDKKSYFNPLLKLKDYKNYNKENLNDGYTRLYDDSRIFLTEKSEDSQIELTVNDKSLGDIEENLNIEFFFDPGLELEMPSSRSTNIHESHNIAFRKGVAPTLVKDFDVFVDGLEHEKYEIRDNYQRRVKLEIKAKRGTIIKIHLLETYGSKLFGLFEIKLSKKEI